MEAADLLSTLVRVNLVGAAAIAAVLILRSPVRSAFGARVVYRLWLIAPLSMIAALLPARTVLEVMQPAVPVGQTLQGVVEEGATLIGAPIATDSPAAGFDPAVWGIAGWAIGAIALAGVLMVNQVAFQRSLGRMMPEGNRLRTSATGFGPVVLGVLRPRIVLPLDFEARFSAEEQRLVLEHEQTHCRTGDQFVNFGAAILRCICWFNPLVHTGAYYLRLDQELACDAAVVARQPHSRRVYAEAMLKAQFSTSAAPVVCNWPTRSSVLLKQRITALQGEAPGRIRQVAGVSLVAACFAAASTAAWAAQPARIVSVATVIPDVSVEDSPARQAVTAPPSVAQSETQGQTIPAEVNRVTPRDGTPLIRAARAGDVARAQQLLSQGALVNMAARGDGNPLIAAARFTGLEMVELLVEAGADVNAYVPGDETPLINAAMRGDLSVIGYLIDRGADPNLAVPTTNFFGEMRSPLSVAANANVSDYLKTRGARR